MELIDNCEYCKTTTPHMVVVMKEDGEVHIHAPLGNKFLMDKFLETIKKEKDIFEMEKSFKKD